MAVRVAVLLDEAAKGVNAAAVGHHRHMVGPARKRRCQKPGVCLGLIHMVVTPVYPAFAVAANDVQSPGPFGGPGHFAARYGQRGARDPAPRCAGSGAAFDRALRRLVGRQVMHLPALQARIGLGS